MPLFSLTGSPVNIPVIDGSRVTASGDGLRFVPAHRPAHFHVNTAQVGLADLAVKVTCKYDGDAVHPSRGGHCRHC